MKNLMDFSICSLAYWTVGLGPVNCLFIIGGWLLIGISNILLTSKK